MGFSLGLQLVKTGKDPFRFLLTAVEAQETPRFGKPGFFGATSHMHVWSWLNPPQTLHPPATPSSYTLHRRSEWKRRERTHSLPRGGNVFSQAVSCLAAPARVQCEPSVSPTAIWSGASAPPNPAPPCSSRTSTPTSTLMLTYSSECDCLVRRTTPDAHARTHPSARTPPHATPPHATPHALTLIRSRLQSPVSWGHTTAFYHSFLPQLSTAHSHALSTVHNHERNKAVSHF